jgi:hypothetical protein
MFLCLFKLKNLAELFQNLPKNLKTNVDVLEKAFNVVTMLSPIKSKVTKCNFYRLAKRGTCLTKLYYRRF